MNTVQSRHIRELAFLARAQDAGRRLNAPEEDQGAFVSNTTARVLMKHGFVVALKLPKQKRCMAVMITPKGRQQI